MRKIVIILITVITLSILPAPTAQAQDVVSDLLGRINSLRVELGLSPYTLNGSLTAAAQQHAQWMVVTSQVTHIQDNGSSPGSRARANGYNSSWVSENIYMGGLASPDSAWTFWVNSSIHYAGLTSTNFRDIGIASASGAGGHAFVLVFGVPGGVVASPATNNGGGDNQAAPAPPPLPIVGYDEVGNIQYELQSGQTLGDVLLIFGYTWDDLNTMMELNEFTDADIRSLDVGQVVLVPPPQGTYTPVPQSDQNNAESTEETDLIPTPEPDEAAVEVTEEVQNEPELENVVENTATPTVDSQQAQTSGIIPTPDPNLPTITPQATQQVNTLPTLIPVNPAVTEVPSTIAPTQTQSVFTLSQNATVQSAPTLQNNTSPTATITVQAPTPVTEASIAPETSSSSPPLWLIVAIVVQIAILGFATFEYIRRMRRR